MFPGLDRLQKSHPLIGSVRNDTGIRLESVNTE